MLLALQILINLRGGNKPKPVIDTHDGFGRKHEWRNKSRDELREIITRLVKGEFPPTEARPDEIPAFVREAVKAAPREISEAAIQKIVAKVSAQIKAQAARDEMDDEESLFLLTH
jgi:predicted RNA-binding Zn ribbon-like protein